MADDRPPRRSKRAYGAAVVAVLAALTVAVLAGVAIGETWDRPGVADWGNLPNWIEAVSTFAAALGAFVAVIYARRAYVIERDRDVQREEATKRAQADLVCAWVVTGGAPDRPQLLIRNASSLPVREVSALVMRPIDSTDRPTSELAYAATIPPGEPRMWDLFQTLDFGDRPSASECWVMARFWDAAGNVWLRDGFGGLERDQGDSVKEAAQSFGLLPG